MKSALRRILASILFGALAMQALAIDITVLPTDELQQRYEGLTHEFRCMQCQNNSIADSPVDLAAELRRDVKEQLLSGKSDDEIRASMVKRYGNVILFRPPLSGSTAWVWIAPIVVLLGGLVVAFVVVRRRSAMVAGDDTSVDADEPR
ncbi:MAG TPA: cytochrome c-type biogenesis protein [Steroidobacteraceae bacterium]|nr:cytochrome c-type biogenesis protein [Steroidobacteraceae bacterium]